MKDKKFIFDPQLFTGQTVTIKTTDTTATVESENSLSTVIPAIAEERGNVSDITTNTSISAVTSSGYGVVPGNLGLPTAETSEALATLFSSPANSFADSYSVELYEKDTSTLVVVFKATNLKMHASSNEQETGNADYVGVSFYAPKTTFDSLTQDGYSDISWMSKSTATDSSSNYLHTLWSNSGADIVSKYGYASNFQGKTQERGNSTSTVKFLKAVNLVANGGQTDETENYTSVIFDYREITFAEGSQTTDGNSVITGKYVYTPTTASTSIEFTNVTVTDATNSTGATVTVDDSSHNVTAIKGMASSGTVEVNEDTTDASIALGEDGNVTLTAGKVTFGADEAITINENGVAKIGDGGTATVESGGTATVESGGTATVNSKDFVNTTSSSGGIIVTNDNGTLKVSGLDNGETFTYAGVKYTFTVDGTTSTLKDELGGTYAGTDGVYSLSNPTVVLPIVSDSAAVFDTDALSVMQILRHIDSRRIERSIYLQFCKCQRCKFTVEH